MLCLNKEELLQNVDINELKQYMLYSLKTNNSSSKNLTFIKSNETNNSYESSNSNTNTNYNSNTNNSKKQNIIVHAGVPRNRVQINYSKKYSKYNEPFRINNHKNFADKLFWIFYKSFHGDHFFLNLQ
jgi:hypothetical protein